MTWPSAATGYYGYNTHHWYVMGYANGICKYIYIHTYIAKNINIKMSIYIYMFVWACPRIEKRLQYLNWESDDEAVVWE